MAPPPGANGVLPAAVLQKKGPAAAPRGPKANQPRLKLVLRRLPPGLTQNEFEGIIGGDWMPGAGKVDWMVYKKGKISKDSAKPSRPSRCYLHVTAQAHVPILDDHVRQVSFNDAAKSYQDTALIGPPVLEYSPYTRIPGIRRRSDNRVGTIDQEQDFKDFLESLTNPITKPAAPDADAHKPEKVTTTPLIEALREKKANKEKPQGKLSAKHGRGESKEDGGERAEKKILSKNSKDTAAGAGDKKTRLGKAEKAAKEAVKVLNKEASSSKDGAASTEKAAQAAPSPAPERKRGNVNIAKSMLQRDLGIGPAAGRRRGAKRDPAPATQETSPTPETGSGKQKAKEVPAAIAPTAAAAVASEKATSASPKKERPSRAERRAYKATLAEKTNNKNAAEDPKAQTKPAAAPAPVILKKPQSTQHPTPPKGPAASRVPPTEPAAARNASSQPKATGTKADVSAQTGSSTTPTPTQPVSAPQSQSPAPTSRQAFLKHANASQGITEPLIEDALKIFGDIENVEIDKRKGFAYVDFVHPEGLQKAMAASPVNVAQGAVQVLERKEKVVRRNPHPGPHPHGPPTGAARGGRGGFAPRGRGRGGARGGHIVSGAAASEVSSTPPTVNAVPAATHVAT